MPEYLTPGVYVEEVSYRAKSIEGVSTTTTGFVGPTRLGPTEEDLEVITSLAAFESTYGDGRPLEFAGEGEPSPNFVWQAARAFFDQGGRRLYVKRIEDKADRADDTRGTLTVASRHLGAGGARRVLIELRAGPNLLVMADGNVAAPGAHAGDVVWVSTVAAASPPGGGSPPTITGELPTGSPPGSPPNITGAVAEVVVAADGTVTLRGTTGSLPLDALFHHPDPTISDQLRSVTASVTIFGPEPDDLPAVYPGLRLDEDPADGLLYIFGPNGAGEVTIDAGGVKGDALAAAIAVAGTVGTPPGDAAAPATTLVSLEFQLEGGSDGNRPDSSAYQGDIVGNVKHGLVALQDVPEISIVAAPGATYEPPGQDRADDIAGIQQALIGHAEHMRYRIAVLDSINDQTIGEVSRFRGAMDSTHAALYYPWVSVMDPVGRQRIDLPPSGFVAGIYARNDIQRAVYKAPANEVVTGAIGLERLINFDEQSVLNPIGVNCLRALEGRGLRVWGARTISSDPEWKYVNLRRYFAYLERSIDIGTQWAVFEPNGERLWANVRRTVSDFLFNEFQNGALLGDKPEVAFFVKCDRSTMTQNDLDNGRLVCMVGVAALRPAEFVIFRIGQWTADRR
jgi:phage tail sheath protein FI